MVSGSTATVEFTGLGDFETFQCDLDREGLKSCKIIIYIMRVNKFALPCIQTFPLFLNTHKDLY